MYPVFISDMLYIFPVIWKQSEFKPRIKKSFSKKLFKHTSIIERVNLPDVSSQGLNFRFSLVPISFSVWIFRASAW